MEMIKGRLQSVGSATIVNNVVNVYNTLEINGRMFQRIKAARAMGDILSNSLGEELSIWIVADEIVGAQRQDGRAYVMKKPKRPGVISLVFGVAMIFMYGLGLILLWIRNKKIKIANEVDQVHAALPGAGVFDY